MTSIAMSRPGRAPLRTALTSVDRRHILEWYLVALVVGFLIPFVGVNLLGLHHDLYLLVYFTVAGTFLASFAAHAGIDWRGLLRTRLWWSLGIGAAVAFATVRNVMNEASMPHPSGSFFWFELAWRGVVYGVTDALILFVFPAAVAYLLLRDADRRRRVKFAALTVALSMGITAAYHLGYPQFRGTDLVQPEIGALVANVPAGLTGNPLGAILVHGTYHVAANVHTYRSPIFLPPDLDGYAERGSGTAGPAFTAAWIVIAGGGLFLGRRRLFPGADER